MNLSVYTATSETIRPQPGTREQAILHPPCQSHSERDCQISTGLIIPSSLRGPLIGAAQCLRVSKISPRSFTEECDTMTVSIDRARIWSCNERHLYSTKLSKRIYCMSRRHASITRGILRLHRWKRVCSVRSTAAAYSSPLVLFPAACST